jgi:hypothetical protein
MRGEERKRERREKNNTRREKGRERIGGENFFEVVRRERERKE